MLSTFHNIPEQSFAFNIKEGIEPSPIPLKGIALPLSYLRTYEDVLLQLHHTLLGYSIQHTYCLSSCGLLNLTSSIRGLTLPLL